MEMIPASVGAASRAWDEQSLDLQAASQQVGGAPTGGFTSAVSGTAARFTAAWSRHCATLGEECEAQADGLRVTMNDWLRTDGLAADGAFAVLPYLREVR